MAVSCLQYDQGGNLTGFSCGNVTVSGSEGGWHYHEHRGGKKDRSVLFSRLTDVVAEIKQRTALDASSVLGYMTLSTGVENKITVIDVAMDAEMTPIKTPGVRALPGKKAVARFVPEKGGAKERKKPGPKKKAPALK